MNKNVKRGAKIAGWLVRGVPAYSQSTKDMRKRAQNGVSALRGFKDFCLTTWSCVYELWNESGRQPDGAINSSAAREEYKRSHDMLFVKKAEVLGLTHNVLWLAALLLCIVGFMGAFAGWGLEIGGIRFGAGFLVFMSLVLIGFNLFVVSYFVMMNRLKVFVPYVVFLSRLRKLDSSAWAPKIGV